MREITCSWERGIFAQSSVGNPAKLGTLEESRIFAAAHCAVRHRVSEPRQIYLSPAHSLLAKTGSKPLD
jgi:hypothetical protein